MAAVYSVPRFRGNYFINTLMAIILLLPFFSFMLMLLLLSHQSSSNKNSNITNIGNQDQTLSSSLSLLSSSSSLSSSLLSSSLLSPKVFTIDSPTDLAFLRKNCEEIKINDIKNREKNISKMVQNAYVALDEFYRKNGYGRGISAPQLGYNVRFIVLCVDINGNRLPEGSRITLFNPRVIWESNELFTMWDDCLSHPDIMVCVRRNKSIGILFIDDNGEEQRWNYINQSMSELLQHELDHLDGKLAIDRAIPCISTSNNNKRMQQLQNQKHDDSNSNSNSNSNNSNDHEIIEIGVNTFKNNNNNNNNKNKNEITYTNLLIEEENEMEKKGIVTRQKWIDKKDIYNSIVDKATNY